MEKIAFAIEHYFQEALGQKVKVHLWRKQKELPFFLLDSYNFYEFKLLTNACLLMVAKKGLEVTPALVRKHWEQLLKKWDGPCIFVQETISAYNRKRLIEHRVPFLVPGNQLYLPELGIDLREHFRKLRNPKKFLSPATQAIIVYALLKKAKEKLNPSYLVKELGYTHMTMTRALDELEEASIGTVYREGRERFWVFEGSKRELWEQTKPMLRSPVKTRVWLKHKKPKIAAGLTALSYFTMINPPTVPVYAISWEEWKRWKKSEVEELPSSEEAAFELEIWYYDPHLFAKDSAVDLFSLYLSLQTNGDERIETAMEELAPVCIINDMQSFGHWSKK